VRDTNFPIGVDENSPLTGYPGKMYRLKISTEDDPDLPRFYVQKPDSMYDDKYDKKLSWSQILVAYKNEIYFIVNYEPYSKSELYITTAYDFSNSIYHMAVCKGGGFSVMLADGFLSYNGEHLSFCSPFTTQPKLNADTELEEEIVFKTDYRYDLCIYLVQANRVILNPDYTVDITPYVTITTGFVYNPTNDVQTLAYYGVDKTSHIITITPKSSSDLFSCFSLLEDQNTVIFKTLYKTTLDENNNIIEEYDTSPSPSPLPSPLPSSIIVIEPTISTVTNFTVTLNYSYYQCVGAVGKPNYGNTKYSFQGVSPFRPSSGYVKVVPTKLCTNVESNAEVYIYDTNPNNVYEFQLLLVGGMIGGGNKLGGSQLIERTYVTLTNLTRNPITYYLESIQDKKMHHIEIPSGEKQMYDLKSGLTISTEKKIQTTLKVVGIVLTVITSAFAIGSLVSFGLEVADLAAQGMTYTEIFTTQLKALFQWIGGDEIIPDIENVVVAIPPKENQALLNFNAFQRTMRLNPETIPDTLPIVEGGGTVVDDNAILDVDGKVQKYIREVFGRSDGALVKSLLDELGPELQAGLVDTKDLPIPIQNFIDDFQRLRLQIPRSAQYEADLQERLPTKFGIRVNRLHDLSTVHLNYSMYKEAGHNLVDFYLDAGLVIRDAFYGEQKLDMFKDLKYLEQTYSTLKHVDQILTTMTDDEIDATIIQKCSGRVHQPVTPQQLRICAQLKPTIGDCLDWPCFQKMDGLDLPENADIAAGKNIARKALAANKRYRFIVTTGN
jgi:hypothetical protein